ncbi:MAG: hypothetical protein L3K06_01955 [Thermoplasmata archaeon]|nr:hypothetical protein [Thermoplasmata archaeon]
MSFDPSFETTQQVTQIIFTGTDDNADGIVDGVIPGGQVPPGLYWLVEVETFKTDSTTLAPSFELFASSEVGVQLRDFGLGLLGGDGFYESANQPGTPIRFWPQESLVVRFAGGDAGMTVACYLQIRVTQAKGAAAGAGPEVVMPVEPVSQDPPPGGWNAGQGRF